MHSVGTTSNALCFRQTTVELRVVLLQIGRLGWESAHCLEWPWLATSLFAGLS